MDIKHDIITIYEACVCLHASERKLAYHNLFIEEKNVFAERKRGNAFG